MLKWSGEVMAYADGTCHDLVDLSHEEVQENPAILVMQWNKVAWVKETLRIFSTRYLHFGQASISRNSFAVC